MRSAVNDLADKLRLLTKGQGFLAFRDRFSFLWLVNPKMELRAVIHELQGWIAIEMGVLALSTSDVTGFRRLWK